ncbi:MAG: hypothetical protein IJ061_07180 [Lachnospiraceae bacterium]|nr:hypothetical protein [Lachnospiraceae bacterium]
MISKEKVRLMTDLAMYRKKNEQIFRVTKYFGYDYIVWHMLLAAVRYTICALVLAALFVVFDAEDFFYNVNLDGLDETLMGFVKYYLTGLIVFLLISAVVYYQRYKKSRNGMLLYSSKLKRLARKFHYV